MKVKFWTYINNNGDGSASALFFTTREQAEEYSEKIEAAMGEGSWAEDCIDPHELEFNEKGELLNPDVYDDSFDD